MRPLTDEETKTMFEKLSKYIGENIKLLVDRPDGSYCFRLHNDRVYYMSEKILKLATNISRDKLVSVGTCFGKFTKTSKFRLHITALDYLAPYAKMEGWVKCLSPRDTFGVLGVNSVEAESDTIKDISDLSPDAIKRLYKNNMPPHYLCWVIQVSASPGIHISRKEFKVWVKPGAEQSFLYGNHVLKSGLGRITENTVQYQGVVVYSMADVPLGFGVAAKSTQECRRVDPMSIVVFHQTDVGEFIRNEDTLT